MKEKNNLWITCAVMLMSVTGCLGGGYFVFVSAGLAIILLIVLLMEMCKSKQYILALDMNMLSLSVVTGMYLCVSLWAIDSGMAMMGFVKFLPVFLWGIFICRHLDIRESIIHAIPYIGSLMTLFSFIMMQFDVFKDWVSVSGRLSGFFQYPNTYAVFMLVSMIIAVDEFSYKNPEIWNIFNIVVSVAGIFLSGSRMVYVLFVLTFLLLLIRKQESRKLLVVIMGLGIVVIVLEAVFGKGTVLQRILAISAGESTLLGRILYWKDAIRIIASHPFGTGYYGYYYLQQEMQTGVYSVVNAHNEFIQLALDLGILPAIFVFGNFIRMILKAERGKRNQLVLSMLLLHSLFDYDFQFMIIWMTAILFFDFHNIREGKIPGFTRSCAVIVGGAMIILSGVIGASDMAYMRGNTGLALKFYSGNMQARITRLSEAKDTLKMKKQAEKILERNKHIAVAYSALARVAFAEGDVQTFMKDKLTAIKLAPYQYDEYVDYLDTLLYCADKYLDADDRESARTCIFRAAQIPGLLQEVEKNTSDLGWRINDLPKVKLSHENLSRIEAYQNKINQN